MASRTGKLTFEAVRTMIANRMSLPGFESLVFQQLKLLSAADGMCRCELNVQSKMLNVSGKLHGGVTASLVDAVSTYALTTTGEGRPGSSIDLNVSYLRPVNEGESIIITAQTLRCGRQVAVCSVEVTNKSSGQLLAHGKHTKYVGDTAPTANVREEGTHS